MTWKSKYNLRIKILITGCSGFVGLNLTHLLKKKKLYQLFCSPKKLDLSKQKNFFDLILNYQPHIIIHLASRTVSTIRNKIEDKLQYKNTYLPVKNLISSLKKSENLKKIIIVGSIEEYGIAKLPFKENCRLRPVSSYGIYKYKSFKYFIRKIKNFPRIKYYWLRPSLMYGPHDSNKRLIGIILNSIDKKIKTKVYINEKLRDIIFVGDFCRLISIIVKRNMSSFITNVTAQNFIRLNLLTSFLKKKFGKRFNRYIKIERSHSIENYCSSANKFKTLFPNFSFVSFSRGIDLTLKNLKSSKKVNILKNTLKI
jgi:nucleoside-diphosphate-sugar epimerase